MENKFGLPENDGREFCVEFPLVIFKEELLLLSNLCGCHGPCLGLSYFWSETKIIIKFSV
jgi:hypothetical protein